MVVERSLSTHLAGVSAKTLPAEGKDHGTINADLGLPHDKPTKALFEFLESIVKKQGQLQVGKESLGSQRRLARDFDRGLPLFRIRNGDLGRIAPWRRL